jgi:chemotaxis protein methyltransferase CheR
VTLEPLIAFLEARAGWTLARGGVRQVLERFVADRTTELQLASSDDYASRVMVNSREFERLLEAVTVTHSWLFRDAHQFGVIERWMIQRGRETLNVWVPGCASGEDAYTLAMLGLGAGIAVNVLGTDINTGALSAASRARYDAWSSRDVPLRFRGFLLPRADGTFEVSEEVQRRVRFERHNLVEPALLPGSAGKWDLIVCRNVLIYFAETKARNVLDRLAQTLEPEGCLILGATDLIHEVPLDLEPRHVDERLLLVRTPRGRRTKSPAPATRSTPKARQAPVRPPQIDSIVDRDAERLKAGLSEMKIGHLPRSLELFQSVCESDPLRSEAHLCLGIAHHLAGNSEQALPALRAALLLDPGLWPASYYLALCFENLGHWREAQREFERVLQAEGREVRALGMPELDEWRGDLVTLARRRLALDRQRG